MEYGLCLESWVVVLVVIVMRLSLPGSCTDDPSPAFEGFVFRLCARARSRDDEMKCLHVSSAASEQTWVNSDLVVRCRELWTLGSGIVHTGGWPEPVV